MELSSEGECDLKLMPVLLLLPATGEANAVFFKSAPSGADAVVVDGKEQPTESADSAIVFKCDGRPRIRSMPLRVNHIKTKKSEEALSRSFSKIKNGYNS